MEKLVPLQIDRGGPVILMQVENEYGSYSNDREYLRWLRDLMRAEGITVPLATSDSPDTECLNGGTIEGVMPTVNFGSRAGERFRVLRQYRPDSPLMCMEFWVGWFDYWGSEKHMTGDLEQSVKDLDKLLELGHVNIYMFEGGTNFGFLNGSNYYDELTPDVTSYDYDAALDILVENMGRVNFGPRLEEQRKGIDRGVTVNGHWHTQWRQYPLPLDNTKAIDFSKEYQDGLPGFYHFTFTAEELGDTFLDFEGWGKGCVFVNGFNIGRFWEIGPQKRMYIPAPLLKQGTNEIIVFETEGKAGGSIVLRDVPDIG